MTIKRWKIINENNLPGPKIYLQVEQRVNKINYIRKCVKERKSVVVQNERGSFATKYTMGLAFLQKKKKYTMGRSGPLVIALSVF